MHLHPELSTDLYSTDIVNLTSIFINNSSYLVIPINNYNIIYFSLHHPLEPLIFSDEFILICHNITIIYLSLNVYKCFQKLLYTMKNKYKVSAAYKKTQNGIMMKYANELSPMRMISDFENPVSRRQ